VQKTHIQENDMTALSKLTLIAATKPNALAPIVQKRNKLLKKLHEQIELATALAEGRNYTATKLRTVTDDAGNTKTVEQPKRIRQWWWTADNGKLCLTVRYGAKLLELAKGKTAIELASADELVAVLETVKAAVAAGELDAAITATSGAVRSSFKQ
jgi:predicted nicotinamide N-methyase